MIALIDGDAQLWAGLIFGVIFGVLLQKGGVTSYNVIVNQFRLRDFTVMKIMLTAIIVGGAGVLCLHGAGLANWHIKPADMLAVGLGALLFGIGMVLCGYCPGTALAAVGTGSLHALVSVLGMLVGGVLYALTFDWVAAHILPVASLGKVRLPDVTGIPGWIWIIGLAAGASYFFYWLEKKSRAQSTASRCCCSCSCETPEDK